MLNLTVKKLTPESIFFQIADIFIEELNKIKPDCSLNLIARLLEPFLKSLGKLEAGRIRDRIIEKIFKPLLENNTTMTQMEMDELEEADLKYSKAKYVFSCFNILVYA